MHGADNHLISMHGTDNLVNVYTCDVSRVINMSSIDLRIPGCMMQSFVVKTDIMCIDAQMYTTHSYCMNTTASSPLPMLSPHLNTLPLYLAEGIPREHRRLATVRFVVVRMSKVVAVCILGTCRPSAPSLHPPIPGAGLRSSRVHTRTLSMERPRMNAKGPIIVYQLYGEISSKHTMMHWARKKRFAAFRNCSYVFRKMKFHTSYLCIAARIRRAEV